METKYYLPINERSLAHYFSRACIVPSKYLQNKPTDIQDNFGDFLLLTTHFGIRDINCLLEITLTKEEQEELIDEKNGFFLYQKPLPISRIRKIFFNNEETKRNTITNISISTAFVPQNIIEVSNFANKELSPISKPLDIHLFDWGNDIDKFNRFLGGFSLMKLSGEEYMNYSENYFSTLSFFNSKIENELEKANRKVNNLYFDIFIGNAYFKALYPILNKKINDNDLENIANAEGQKIEKDKISRIVDLDNLDKGSYIVAVLNTYGTGDEGKKKKIDDLIFSNFKLGIKQDKSEVVALCYGFNRGYSSFPNKYELGNKRKDVKFKLNSQLDYYTIESIYQQVFNKKKSNELPYIDNWCPKQSLNNISKKKTDYQILDEIVIGKKKPKVNSQVYLANLLHSFFQKNSEVLFKELIEKLRLIIYNDTKEEIEEEYQDKLDEERKKIAILQVEINNIRKNSPQKQLNSSTSQEKTPESSNISQQEKIELAKNIIEYQSMTIKMLQERAKQEGIDIKGLKKDELIIQLVAKRKNPSLFQY